MKNLLLVLAVIGIVFFTGCGSDSSKDDGGDKTGELKTPEENKEAIQAIAVDVVQEMSAFESTASMQAAISMGLLLGGSNDDAGSGRLEGARFINQSIVELGTRELTPIGLSKRLFSIDAAEAETLNDFWEENKGIYDWDQIEDDFVTVTEGGDIIQLNFPATDGGTTNNASLTFRSYTGVTIANPIDEDYTGDLPASLLVDLFIDDVKEMEFSFDIDYNSNGEPEMVETSLFMNPFTLSINLTNTTSKVAHGFDFDNAGSTILGASFEMNGDFSEQAILDAEDNQDNIPNVLNDAGFTLTMLNLQIAGEIIVEPFYNKVENLKLDQWEWIENPLDEDLIEDNAVKLEEALNSHTNVSMTYVDSGDKAADIEWKTGTEKYVDDWSHEIYVTLGANMIFEDGSKVDLEDYLTVGFEQLEAELNALIDQFGDDVNEDLGDIDFDDID